MIVDLVVGLRGSGKSTLCKAWNNDIPNSFLFSPDIRNSVILPRDFPKNSVFIVDELSYHSLDFQRWVFNNQNNYDFYITIGAEGISRLINPWQKLLEKDYPEWMI